MLPSSISGVGIVFLGCLSVRVVITILHKHFGEIYNFGALNDKYELIRFWVRKVKGHDNFYNREIL